MMIGLLFPLYQ